MAELTQSTMAHFSRREIVSILFGLILAMFLASLDQTIVATSLSTMAQRSERLGADVVGGLGLSRRLDRDDARSTAGSAISTAGGRSCLVAIALFLGASVLCALSQTMPQLIGARVLQGIGGGGLRSVALAAIADIIPPRERGRYQGYFSSVMAISNVLGPVLGGFFAEYLTWHWIFWINMPFGAAGARSVQPQPSAPAKAEAKAGHRLARRGADPRLDDADSDRGRPGRSGGGLGHGAMSRPAGDRHRASWRR